MKLFHTVLCYCIHVVYTAHFVRSTLESVWDVWPRPRPCRLWPRPRKIFLALASASHILASALTSHIAGLVNIPAYMTTIPQRYRRTDRQTRRADNLIGYAMLRAVFTWEHHNFLAVGAIASIAAIKTALMSIDYRDTCARYLSCKKF